MRVEQLRLIAGSKIGENGDDGVAGPHVSGETNRAGDIDSARSAEAQPLVLQQVEDDRDRFLVGNQICLVDLDVLDQVGHASKPDALGDGAAFRHLGLSAREQIVHGGALRIGDADDDVRLALAQIGRCAGDGAAGADGADETVHLAVGLLPYLRPGGHVVRLAIVHVVPLIGEQDAVRLALAQVVRQAPPDVLIVVRIAVGDRRHLHQIGAVQAQHVLLFLALRFGDDDQGAVAACIGDQCEPDPGIAGGALDHQTARPDVAAPLGLQDDLARRPVLDRLARIHELGLAENRAAGRCGGGLEQDQRRIADSLDGSVADLHVLDFHVGGRLGT